MEDQSQNIRHKAHEVQGQEQFAKAHQTHVAGNSATQEINMFKWTAKLRMYIARRELNHAIRKAHRDIARIYMAEHKARKEAQ